MKTLKYAIRFLSRQKAFSAINILGLALSLACCLVLSRYLHREFTVDSHAKNPETIMIINRQSDSGNSIIGTHDVERTMEKGLVDFLKNETIESCQYITNPECSITINDKSFSIKALAADSLLLNFFQYRIEGDQKGLYRNNGCWVSRNYISKLGLTTQELIGTKVNAANNEYEITGIFDEPDCKTIIKPDFIFAFGDNMRWLRNEKEWIRVHDNFDLEKFNTKVLEFKELPENEKRTTFMDNCQKIYLTRWSDYYFSGQAANHKNELTNAGNHTMCWVLIAVLCLILAVGMLNFVNLYLVYWQRRTREEGVRKVFGQRPAHLFKELWTELFVMVGIAVFAAWTMVELSAPWINPIMGHDFGWSAFDIVITLAMLMILPMMALGYPLAKQNRNTPLQSLQERVGSRQNIKSRTAVLAFQYLITFSLLIVALWMRSQLDYLTNSPAGYDTEHILITKPVKITRGYVNREWVSNAEEASATVNTIINRLEECPAIEKTAIGDHTPIYRTPASYKFHNYKDEVAELDMSMVSKEWFEVFNIKLMSGRLSTGKENNDDRSLANMFGEWVVNEEALRLLGYSSIDNAYAQSEAALAIGYNPETQSIVEYGKESYPIGGLVQTHYAQHRTLGATPILYWIQANEYTYNDSKLFVRAYPGKEREALEYYKKVCEEVCPNEELDYHWFKDDVDKLYNDDRLISKIYTLFSSIAIAICCLGLLGLSMFDIRQRFREVAIRKAHGAKRKHLYMLLGKKYIWLLLATFAASIPITIFVISKYTEGMMESAPISVWIYILSLLIVAAITAATLVIQLEKASKINVSEAMKRE